MSVKPIPDGYHSVTPYLIVADALSALKFYAEAFGAVEIMRMPMPDGKIAHAEIRIGDSFVMLADESPQWKIKSPIAYGGTPVSLMIYVEDSDAVVTLAASLGATIIKPMMDQFYGDRSGTIVDPFGHQWTISTHKEDVAPDELARRAAALFANMQGGQA